MDQSVQLQHVPFRFSGRGGEYFRIWIVNLFLSILTLGIYSAWAKVRRLQYFYRHTTVAGASFDYHGDPVAILKGRIVAALLFIINSVAGNFSLIAGLAGFVLIMLVVPWLLVRSFRFKLHNTSWRGLRFAFHGKVGDGYINFLLMPLLAYASLGLLSPLAHHQIRRYLHNNSTFGDERFAFHAGVGAFFKPYAIALLGFILITASVFSLVFFTAHSGSGIAASTGLLFAIAIYLFALLLVGPYIAARLQNVIWSNTMLGPHQLESRVTARGMFGIMASNFLLVLLTLGLFKPFADIRLARYRLEHMAVMSAPGLDEFLAGTQVSATATGEEMADFFDFDIAL